MIGIRVNLPALVYSKNPGQPADENPHLTDSKRVFEKFPVSNIRAYAQKWRISMAVTRIDEITRKLRAQGCDPALLSEVQEALEAGALEEASAGILRTRKGALMVRVGNERWPVAMYKKDWKILLSKVPFIQKALEEMDILEENPSRTLGQDLAEEAEIAQAAAGKPQQPSVSEYEAAMRIIRARKAS